MKKNKMESLKWKGASIHLLAVFVLLFLMGCNSSSNPSKGTEAASDSTAKVVETDEVSGTNEEEAYMACFDSCSRINSQAFLEATSSWPCLWELVAF